MALQSCYNGVKLTEEGPCPRNVERIDLGALPMIAHYQQVGMRVDPPHFEKMGKTLAQDLDFETEEVHRLTGHYINIDSGDQVSKLLFKDLGLKQARPKMTKSGDRESVEDEVLTAIQHDHPCVSHIQAFKEYSKLKGTYVEPLLRLAMHTGFNEWVVYPNLSQSRIPSGRLNAKDPNVLAMPTRTERGREIRKGFIARKGRKLVAVDLSQIEPRIAAHRSKDESLVKVYRDDEDVYSDFAITAFKLKDERYYDAAAGKWKYPHVSKDDHRRPCKTCVLAALYDVTGKGLLDQMPIICANCSKEATKHDCGSFKSVWHEENCQGLLNQFYMKYAGLIKMRQRDHTYVRRHGFITDIWGRILHSAAVKSVLEWVVSAALREIANHPMQSSAAGVIKLAMAQCMDLLERYKLLFHTIDPILQVHDELLFDTVENLADELIAWVSDIFAKSVKLLVPIKAGAGSAYSWGELER